MTLQLVMYLKFLIICLLFINIKFIPSENKSSKSNCDSLTRIVKNINTDAFEHKRIDIYDKVVEEEVRKIYRWGSSFVNGYYKNNELIIIVSQHEGDRETQTSTYIVKGKNFLIKKEILFFHPTKSQENTKIHNKEEQYFYISNNTLINWCKDGISVNDTTADYRLRGGLLMREFRNYKELLNKE